ncbi:DUF6907 domain-containing protein [Streptomyces sp. NPDC014724]|uniref:DUF6907 domain-containing protein n=1 Tax=unclassified Streptomyces TaxID=2593676 RepID=UPI003701AEBC
MTAARHPTCPAWCTGHNEHPVECRIVLGLTGPESVMTHDGEPLHFAELVQYPYGRCARRHVGVYVELFGFGQTLASAELDALAGARRPRRASAGQARDLSTLRAAAGTSEADRRGRRSHGCDRERRPYGCRILAECVRRSPDGYPAGLRGAAGATTGGSDEILTMGFEAFDERVPDPSTDQLLPHGRATVDQGEGLSYLHFGESGAVAEAVVQKIRVLPSFLLILARPLDENFPGYVGRATTITGAISWVAGTPACFQGADRRAQYRAIECAAFQEAAL